MTESPLVYRLENVIRVWGTAPNGFRLEVPRLEVAPGARIAVVGTSGCGKSTLLDLLGLALSPSSAARFEFSPVPGEANAIETAWAERGNDRLSELRRQYIGYVIQTGGLLPFLSVRENIALSRLVLNLPDNGVVDDLAERAGIRKQLDRMPAALSVGERQRVAVARALAHAPAVIVADEPTASLDPLTATQIMTLLLDLATDAGSTVIVSSHDWARMKSLEMTHVHHEVGTAPDTGMTVSTFRN